MSLINNLIYFDNNATTVMDAAVAESMQAFVYSASAVPELVEGTRTQVASLIGCQPSEVFFTSGTTASIHTGMQAVFDAHKHKGRHIITNITEHGEVLNACETLKQQGAEVTCLGVDKEGLIDLHELKAAIKPSTIMVSIMAANNQTGVIQPAEQIAELCRENNLIFFSDASQFVGKMRCDVNELGIDAMAFGAHKMHGPKGIGVLYLKNTTAAHANLPEKNKKITGSQAVLLAGLAKAAALFTGCYWEDSAHISKIKNYFEHQLLDIEGLRINGSTRYRLYNTSNLTFPAHKDLNRLAQTFNFTSFTAQGSHVLSAMSLSGEDIKNSFRFSFGKYNTLDEVKQLVEEINKL